MIERALPKAYRLLLGGSAPAAAAPPPAAAVRDDGSRAAPAHAETSPLPDGGGVTNAELADRLRGVTAPDEAGEASPAGSPGTPALRPVSPALESTSC